MWTGNVQIKLTLTENLKNTCTLFGMHGRHHWSVSLPMLSMGLQINKTPRWGENGENFDGQFKFMQSNVNMFNITDDRDF